MKNKYFKCLLLLLCLAVIMSLCMAGCGGGGADTDKKGLTIGIPETLSLKVEEKYMLTPTVTGELTSELKYESSDSSVAIIESGLITAKKIGNCEITVSCGEVSAKCSVSVSASEKLPTVFTGVKDNSIGISIGGTFRINAYIVFDGVQIASGITYQSQDASIASVSANGEVLGVSYGKTNIVVIGEHLGNQTKQMIEVNVFDSGISFSLENGVENLCVLNNPFAKYPKERDLKITVINNDEDITDSLDFNWQVEEKELGVETVSLVADGSNATVTAKNVGSANVKVSFTFLSHDYIAYCNVITNKVAIEEQKYLAEKDNEGKAIIVLPTEYDVETVESVKVNGNDVSFKNGDNNSVVVEMLSGQNVEISSKNIVYTSNVMIVDKVFMQEDVQSFASVIESNLAGYYVLGEDLDFTGVNFKSIGGLESSSDEVKSFSGTFDGNGYEIKNLTVTGRNVKDQYGVYKTGAGNVFASNSGTVTNVAVSFTTPNVDNYVGFIGSNYGTVNNVLVNVTLTANMDGIYSQANGSVVCNNQPNGTVTNCIAIVNSKGLNVNQKFGYVVGMNCSGASYPIKNNYAVSNGLSVTYGLGGQDVLYRLSYDAETRKAKNSAVYTNVALLSANVSLDSDEGWNDGWAVEENTLKFNALTFSEKYLGAFEYNIVQDKTKVGFTKDFGSEISENITSALLNGEEADIFSGKVLTVPYQTLKALPVGVFTVTLKTPSCTYKLDINRLTAVVTLTQTDAENLQSIIESDLSCEYVLGEDIDMTGVTFKSIGGVDSGSGVSAFTGVIDGNGHAIKNLTITGRSAKDQWGVPLKGSSNFIAYNKGTVKNIYFDVTMANKDNFVGIIGENEGTVNNLFVDITLTGNMTGGSAQMSGGVAARLSGGTIKNCIVNIHASGLSGNQVFGTVVGMNYSGAEYPIANCYAITNGMAISYGTAFGGGRDVLYGLSYDSNIRRPKNSVNYETTELFFEGVTELSSANGWASYWRLAEDGLYFGTNKVVNK